MPVIQLERSVGLDREARLIYRGEKRILNEAAGSSLAIGDYVLRTTFRILKDKWMEDTINYSAPTDIFNHPAYFQILRFGQAFLRYILEDLPDNPYHWFSALTIITGQSPIKPGSLGDVDQMVSDWLEWGQEMESV